MLNKHKEIQKWIKRKYSTYEVFAEAIDGINSLPDKKSHVYQPDVLLKNPISKEIEIIFEVENDPMRKNLVGASILADHSIRLLKQKIKPTLIFIIYQKNGIKQIHNFKTKIAIAKKYCSYLKDIQIFSEEEFKKLRL